MRTLTTVTVLLVAAGGVVGTAQAEPGRVPDLRIGLNSMPRDVITPVEWAGIWEIEDEAYVCEPRELLNAEAYTDTICAGTSIEFGDPEFEITCEGSADGNTVTVICNGEFEVMEDCMMEFTTEFTATRDGDTFESVQVISMTTVGAGCLFPIDDCTRIETVATRVAPAPDPCEQTPVESVDWGTVKSLYR
jgi:hypothetical protein